MALIQCPDCGKEFSDSAKQCPNCGYRSHVNQRKPSDHKKVLGWILFIIGLICFWPVIYHFYEYQPPYGPMIMDSFAVVALVCVVLGILCFFFGGRFLSSYYRNSRVVSFCLMGLMELVLIPQFTRGFTSYEGRQAYDEKEREENEIRNEEQRKMEATDPYYLEYYYGTWEYTQPNNQDGVRSVKLVVNRDKTVQALVDVKGKEIVVYGSWYQDTSHSINMRFNDTKEHINGILYIDLLRIFRDYNDYFGITYGQINHDYDNGKTYLYEDSSDVDAKNPNKRVEINKIN